MPARKDIKSILIIGSGPIVIGQACEFDYSGNQALRALKEEGYRVILVNPNPATIMTTPGVADAIYMDPLEVEFLEQIIRAERPDAVLPTMGGQTALNLAIELDAAGVFARYGVELIGASIRSIKLAEDRGEFKRLMDSIGLASPRSRLIGSNDEALAVLSEFGLPLIIRPSFTLGGKGGSIARSADEARTAIARALSESPVHTALVEESLIGWKEFELEVMRDAADNAVIICSIENIDPMGVHTGDSITVAPIQTLSDTEYQRMRTAAIDILRAVGVDCGGSNVQFGLNPYDGRMVVIEMNPRVSRSSALASKATGFPIARSAAKLAVGYTLDEIINEITGQTVSSFEPALDYVAVKVPRFELEKFPKGYRSLGTQMKSVGESLALGRSFSEALNKAMRAAESGFEGVEELPGLDESTLWAMLETLHPRRLLAAYSVLVKHAAAGATDLSSIIARISAVTGFDPWFLHYLSVQALFEAHLRRADRPWAAPATLLEAKRMGLTDKRIAALVGAQPEEVAAARRAVDITAGYHFVDTCAGEFAAATPYFYGTYGETSEVNPLGDQAVLIIGSGPNRIGQGLEFDTCCTLSSLAYRRAGVKTIMVNSNPETVSTDFNVSDRLYIEPLTAEDVLAVAAAEGVRRVVVQLGGQTPLNMAQQLQAAGLEVVGTTLEGIHRAEDRGRFASLLRELNLQQPANRIAGTVAAARSAAAEIGFPLLLRPSYVLGGRSMMIVYTPEELEAYFTSGIVFSPDRPVLVDQFLEDAFEYDIDALCDGSNVYVAGIMQHIEAAGIHSGDSACVFPPYKAQPEIERAMIDATVAIARALPVRGLLNIQFAAKGGQLYVLEVNPRASRTVPFVSKASGVNLIDAVVALWLGRDLASQGLVELHSGVGVGGCITGWAVKEAMFSFDRFVDQDPLLGPEMRSTGESIGIGATFGEAFAKATIATGTRLPTRGRAFVSVHQADKATILPIVQELERLGFAISATRGTAAFLFAHGILAEVVLKVHEGHPNIVDHMRIGRIDLVINTPLGRYTQRDDDYIRIEALKYKIPYTTTTSAAAAAVEAIHALREGSPAARKLPQPSTTVL